MLNSEKLKAFPLKSRIRQGCPLSSLLFNIVLDVLGQASNQKKKKKKESKLEKKVKLSLSSDDMILQTGNPKDATGKLLELINESSKVEEYKSNTQKNLEFLYTNNERSERNYLISLIIERKQFHLPSHQKKKSRSKPI